MVARARDAANRHAFRTIEERALRSANSGIDENLSKWNATRLKHTGVVIVDLLILPIEAKPAGCLAATRHAAIPKGGAHGVPAFRTGAVNARSTDQPSESRFQMVR